HDSFRMLCRSLRRCTSLLTPIRLVSHFGADVPTASTVEISRLDGGVLPPMRTTALSPIRIIATLFPRPQSNDGTTVLGRFVSRRANRARIGCLTPVGRGN